MKTAYAALCADTVRALRSEDIRFKGKPRVVRKPPSTGLFVTDSNRVFVKITAQTPMREWEGAKQAASRGVNTPKPLCKPVELDNGLWALPYKYLATEPDPVDPTTAASLLARTWGTRIQPHRAYVTQPTLTESHDRARLHMARNNAAPEMQELLARLVRLTHDRASSLIARDGEPVKAWTHGDAHLGNFVVVKGRTHLIDWERHGIGYREADAAKYLQGLFSAPTARADAPAFLAAVAKEGLNMDLVWALTGVRAANTACLIHGNGVGGDAMKPLPLLVDLAHLTLHANPTQAL